MNAERNVNDNEDEDRNRPCGCPLDHLSDCPILHPPSTDPLDYWEEEYYDDIQD